MHPEWVVSGRRWIVGCTRPLADARRDLVLVETTDHQRPCTESTCSSVGSRALRQLVDAGLDVAKILLTWEALQEEGGLLCRFYRHLRSDVRPCWALGPV